MTAPSGRQLPREPHSDSAADASELTVASHTGISRLFDVIDSRSWTKLGRYFHSEVVYERPGYPAFDGLARVLKFYEHERVIAEGRHHLEATLIDADYGACSGIFIGTHRDGSPIRESFADIYTFRDRLIIHRKSFFFRPAV